MNTSGKYYNAEKFVVHEDYGKPAYAYDIGLIRVQTPIEFNEKVQPIKYSAKKVEADENLQITGWGLKVSNLFTPTKVLNLIFNHHLKIDLHQIYRKMEECQKFCKC